MFDSLRRRFQHNQEDCTITVLELLPTVSENIIDALPSETILNELQQKKAQRLGKSIGISEVVPSDVSSGTPSAADGDGRSISSESYVHASQMGASGLGNGQSRVARSKAQLWGELRISCMGGITPLLRKKLNSRSYHQSFYFTIYSLATDPTDPDTAQSPWSKKLPFKRGSFGFSPPTRPYHQSRKSGR